MREEVKDRHLIIGGSDVAAMFGLHRYKTPQQLQLEKLGGSVTDDALWGPSARGLALEDTVRAMVKAKHPQWTLTPNYYVRHREHSHVVGHLDGIINVDRETHDALGTWHVVHEIKCPGFYVYRAIENDGLPDEWQIQAQWYMRLTGFEQACFTVFCADLWEEPRIIWLEQDRDLQSTLLTEALAWWDRHVVQRIPVDGALPLPAIGVAGKTVQTLEASDALAEALADFDAARELRDQGEELYETAKARIVTMLPGFGKFKLDERSISYYQTPGRVTFDHKALANVKPIDRIKLATVLGTAHALTPDEVKNCELDLAPFTKQGAVISNLRVGK